MTAKEYCNSHIDHENRIKALEGDSEKMEEKMDGMKSLIIATLATTVVGLLVAVVNILAKVMT